MVDDFCSTGLSPCKVRLYFLFLCMILAYLIGPFLIVISWIKILRSLHPYNTRCLSECLLSNIDNVLMESLFKLGYCWVVWKKKKLASCDKFLIGQIIFKQLLSTARHWIYHEELLELWITVSGVFFCWMHSVPEFQDSCQLGK